MYLNSNIRAKLCCNKFNNKINYDEKINKYGSFATVIASKYNYSVNYVPLLLI